jgi:MFS family permease
MTLTLVGEVFLGMLLTLTADKVGRRKVLVGGSLLMISSGLTFAYFENFWILLTAAVFGVISATGSDFGPFRAIEESILSQLTSPRTRADVLAWYITTSTLGSAVGSEVGGRIVTYLQAQDGWKLVDAYHALFWVYTGMGIVNAVFMMLLTDACELEKREGSEYVQVAADEDDATVVEQPSEQEQEHGPDGPAKTNGSKWKVTAAWTWFSSRLAEISAPTRSVM